MKFDIVGSNFFCLIHKKITDKSPRLEEIHYLFLHDLWSVAKSETLTLTGSNAC